MPVLLARVRSGNRLFPLAKPAVILITWGALIGFFVAVRVSGLLVGLQRGDGLPLDNLLHLPFAPHQVFLDGDPRAEVERMTREYTGVSSQRLPRGWVAHGSADGPGSAPWLTVVATISLLAITILGSILATHVLATVFQGGIVFLACCVMGSALSMRLPYAVSLTSMNSRARPSTGLLALLVELVVAASLILIAAGALAAEQAFHEAGHEFPVYLVLSMLEFGVSVVGFRVLLGSLVRQLVQRSDHILDTVAVIN